METARPNVGITTSKVNKIVFCYTCFRKHRGPGIHNKELDRHGSGQRIAFCRQLFRDEVRLENNVLPSLLSVTMGFKSWVRVKLSP